MWSVTGYTWIFTEWHLNYIRSTVMLNVYWNFNMFSFKTNTDLTIRHIWIRLFIHSKSNTCHRILAPCQAMWYDNYFLWQSAENIFRKPLCIMRMLISVRTGTFFIVLFLTYFLQVLFTSIWCDMRIFVWITNFLGNVALLRKPKCPFCSVIIEFVFLLLLMNLALIMDMMLLDILMM